MRYFRIILLLCMSIGLSSCPNSPIGLFRSCDNPTLNPSISYDKLLEAPEEIDLEGQKYYASGTGVLNKTGTFSKDCLSISLGFDFKNKDNKLGYEPLKKYKVERFWITHQDKDFPEKKEVWEVFKNKEYGGGASASGGPSWYADGDRILMYGIIRLVSKDGKSILIKTSKLSGIDISPY